MSMSISDCTGEALAALTLADAIRARDAGRTARALAEAALQRIEEVEPTVQAFAHL